MAPSFLQPEVEVRASGAGPALPLGESRPDSILITLEITRILEQQSIDVSVQGSPDGEKWDAKSLVSFSQKYYCGAYQILLNLTGHEEVRFLRAKWDVNRWGKGDPNPLFGFYLFAQDAAPARVMQATGSAA